MSWERAFISQDYGRPIGTRDGGNHNLIVCADTCDYAPYIEAYGQYFMPKAKVAMEQTYL